MNTSTSHVYECGIVFIQQFDGTTVYTHKKQQRSIFKSPLLKQLFLTTSFLHGLKSKVDSSKAEPNSPLLILKRHFRTSNEGTLIR